MPYRRNIAAMNTDQVTALLMEYLRDFLPALDLDESRFVLRNLKEETEAEIARLRGFTATFDTLTAEAAVSTDYLRLKEIHDTLNALEMDRFLKTYSVPTLHANCTEYRDILAGRALQLVRDEMTAAGNPPPELSYALISMGSDGREEQTLITDQDYLIVYDDGGGEAADVWFKSFSDLLVERLAEIGFKKCTGDIMPSNQTWRGSLSQWKKRLLSIVRYEFDDYAKNLMDLIVVSDARYVAGDPELAKKLVYTIRDLEQDYFQVLWGMAKAATEMKLALGFMKRFWTEGSGEHKGELNLKLLAWAPLVMNIRILAINQGVPATNTVRRIELLQQERSLSPSMAQGLIDAYQILTRHRILLQIKVIKGIQKDSYFLNPYSLPTEEREHLRQAIIRIEELQKIIHTNFSIM